MIKEFQGEYRYLSNFYICRVEVEGIVYPSSEHAYMAQKTLNPDIRHAMSMMESPGQAKRYGRSIKLRDDWEAIKYDCMKKVLLAKFGQNMHLKLRLLSTGNRELQEGNRWGDKTWGVCAFSGQGQNLLGKALMEVREHYRNEAVSAP